jgi:hypothetical protein
VPAIRISMGSGTFLNFSKTTKVPNAIAIGNPANQRSPS